MSRNWIRNCPEWVLARREEAQNSTIYILREIGPTGFLLKEENKQKIIKVLIGETNTCTCAVFIKNSSEACKHICWILWKKFKLQNDNPLSWQKGFCEREIIGLIQSVERENRKRTKGVKKKGRGRGGEGDGARPLVERREVTGDDSCPICQEGLMDDSSPSTYCRFGCGNSVHVKCMRIWASHRKTDVPVECPFCRSEFGPFEDPLSEAKAKVLHPGKQSRKHMEQFRIHCHACGLSPIKGKEYKCDVCQDDFYLCGPCFGTDIHLQHPFSYRIDCNRRWEKAFNRDLLLRIKHSFLFSHLINSNLGADDYEDLLALDDEPSGREREQENYLQDSHLIAFSTKRLKRQAGLNNHHSHSNSAVDTNFSDHTDSNGNNSDIFTIDNNDSNQRSMTDDTNECELCKEGMRGGDEVKMIPCCRKWFHRACIDVWLVHFRAECPLDHSPYSPSIIRNLTHSKANRKKLDVNKASIDKKSNMAKNRLGKYHKNFQQADDCNIQIIGLSTSTRSSVGNFIKENMEKSTCVNTTVPRRSASDVSEIKKNTNYFPDLFGSKKITPAHEKKVSLTQSFIKLPKLSDVLKPPNKFCENNFKNDENISLNIRNAKLNKLGQ